MKVVICWSNVSGYITACWRALAAERDIDLSILAYRSESSAANSTIAFDEDALVTGLNCRLLTTNEQRDANLIRDLVTAQNPDVIVIPGWFSPAYVALTREPSLMKAKFIMTMDTPFKNSLRQNLGRFAKRSLLRRIDGVIVAGERAFQLATFLGIPERKILRGVYGFDEPLFAPIARQRSASAWPRKFLFVGRYVEDKAIDVLAATYEKYRASVNDPWPLTCCGRGPMQHLLRAEGIEDRGFVQPSDLPTVLAAHGVYVIASRYEPWGVAIAEALSSGLPVLCTEACGASVELVRSQFNGLTVATNDADSLARGFRWMHDHVDILPAMSGAAHTSAAAFSATMWARRWKTFFNEVHDPQSTN